MDDHANGADALFPGLLEDENGNLYFAANRIFRANAALGYLIDEDALAAVIGELVGAASLERQSRDRESRVAQAGNGQGINAQDTRDE